MTSAQRILLGAVLAVATSACAQPFSETFQPGTERMPGPASVWLTSEPAAPAGPVPVTMVSPGQPDIRFSHTFVPDEPLRGDFATSQGQYRLAAFGGECSVDVTLGPSKVAEVLLTLDDEGCSFEIERVVDMDDPAAFHDEPSVLITNHGVNEAPVIEPATPP